MSDVANYIANRVAEIQRRLATDRDLQLLVEDRFAERDRIAQRDAEMRAERGAARQDSTRRRPFLRRDPDGGVIDL